MVVVVVVVMVLTYRPAYSDRTKVLVVYSVYFPVKITRTFGR